MKLKKTFGVLVLSSSLVLAGCAGTGAGSSSSSLDSGDDANSLARPVGALVLGGLQVVLL